VESIEGEDAATSRLRIRIERRGRAIRAAGVADGLYEKSPCLRLRRGRRLLRAKSYLINARSKIRAQASCTMPR
jgi:hypothetical protein